MKINRHILVLMLFTLSFYSCKQEVEVPEAMMQPEEMTEFLIDLHIAHAKVQNIKGITQDSAKTLFRHFEVKLYHDHQVEESLYYDSYNFYLDNPELLNEIYTSVVDSLSLKESLNRE